MNKLESRASRPLISRAKPTSLDQRIGWLRRVCRPMSQVSAIVCTAIVLSSSMLRLAGAQDAALPQPQVALTDHNGVDLLSEELYLHQKVISIGSAAHPLTDTIYSGPDGSWYTNPPQFATGSPLIQMTMDSFGPDVIWDQPWGSATYETVYIGNHSEVFCQVGCSTLGAVAPTGSLLTTNAAGPLVYTERDGTQAIFNGPTVPGNALLTMLGETQSPDGRVLTVTYASNSVQVQAVTRSDGMQLVYTYGTIPSGPRQGAVVPVSITAINNAYQYCDPAAVNTCSLSGWPTVYFSWGVPSSGLGMTYTVTDTTGRVTTYTIDDTIYLRTVGVALPSGPGSNEITYAYCSSGSCNSNEVVSVTRNGYTWNYSGTLIPTSGTQCVNSGTYAFTNPVESGDSVSMYSCSPDVNPNQSPVIQYTPSNHLMDPLISFTNKQGEIFTADSDGFEIVSSKMPEGNETLYTWDARGNLTEVTKVPKPGSRLSSVTLSAGYDTTCSNPLTCNEPNWTKDGNGNETDYTYDPNNGRLATVKLPAVPVPGSGSEVPPEIDYTYAQRYAWILNASGSYVESAAPIWVLSTESYCRTSAATSSGCTAANDQVVKTFYYGPNSGPNNLFLRGVAVTADGQTRVTCYGYDKFGNRISVTTPNAGLSLTSCDQYTAN